MTLADHRLTGVAPKRVWLLGQKVETSQPRRPARGRDPSVPATATPAGCLLRRGDLARPSLPCPNRARSLAACSPRQTPCGCLFARPEGRPSGPASVRADVVPLPFPTPLRFPRTARETVHSRSPRRGATSDAVRPQPAGWGRRHSPVRYRRGRPCLSSGVGAVATSGLPRRDLRSRDLSARSEHLCSPRLETCDRLPSCRSRLLAGLCLHRGSSRPRPPPRGAPRGGAHPPDRPEGLPHRCVHRLTSPPCMHLAPCGVLRPHRRAVPVHRASPRRGSLVPGMVAPRDRPRASALPHHHLSSALLRARALCRPPRSADVRCTG